MPTSERADIGGLPVDCQASPRVAHGIDRVPFLPGPEARVNDSLALEGLKKASDQGHSDASFSIGMLYRLGEGEVSKDTDEAIDYYLIAADAGHEDAIAILKSMMLRNDRFVRNRLHSIIHNRESLFGTERLIKAKKLNARKGPSTETKVIARLLKGETVLEVNRQGQWSQVVILGDDDVDRTVWVYNPLLEN